MVNERMSEWRRKRPAEYGPDPAMGEFAARSLQFGYMNHRLQPALLRLAPGSIAPAWWTLLALAVFVLGAGMGVRDPWPTDEPRFNLVAKQMVESGEYLITQRGVELYSDKPPMYMWTQVAAYSLTGNWRVAFLLPSLLAALGVLWLLFDLTARTWSRRAAWWTAFTLLICFQFAFQAKRAQIDMVLLFLITLSLYGFLRHLLRGPAWHWYALGWFVAGIATITKGVGFLAPLILLPAAALALYQGRASTGWAALRSPHWWWMPLLFLLAMSLWLLPMYLATYGSGDPARIAYAEDLLFRQTAKRYTNSWDHQEPFWYFAGVMLASWLPLSLWLPWWAPALWRRLRHRLDPRTVLPLCWAAMVVLFFSFSPGKRDVYILPALPMLVFALAPLLPGLLRLRGPNRVSFVAALLLALALLGLGLAALVGEPGFELREEQRRGLQAGSDALWWVLALSGALAGLLLLWARPRRGVLGWAGCMAVIWTVAMGWGGSWVLNEQNSARGVMQAARDKVGPEIELGLVAWQEQNLLQAIPPVQTFGFEKIPWEQQWADGKAWLMQAPERRRLFVLSRLIDRCVERSKIELAGISNRRRWYLVPAEALRPNCSVAREVSRDGVDERGLEGVPPPR